MQYLGEGDKAINYTGDIKLVSDYANISLFDVQKLNCIVYEMILHDAIVNNLRATEQGQELLKVLSRITIKEADVDTIRKFNEKRGGFNGSKG